MDEILFFGLEMGKNSRPDLSDVFRFAGTQTLKMYQLVSSCTVHVNVCALACMCVCARFSSLDKRASYFSIKTMKSFTPL